MKTIIIQSIFWMLILAYIGQTKVSFSPFKISFEKPVLAIGILLLVIGFSLVEYQMFHDGKMAGLKFNKELIKEVLNEKKQNEQP